MTKFEEEFEHELDYFIERELSLDEKLSFGARDVLVKFFSGWHSPEHIEKEIQMKLLKLQQQALPVVPDCVDKTVELLKKNPESSWSKLYSSLGEEGVTWLNEFQHKDERFGFGGLNSKLFVLFHLAINGYTVEKPQLFYLKHIDLSKRDPDNHDWYLIKDHQIKGKEGLDHDWVHREETPEEEYFKFTQSEIDNMDAGSYEQIEVTE